jgi:hypothetical protein
MKDLLLVAEVLSLSSVCGDRFTKRLARDDSNGARL